MNYYLKVLQNYATFSGRARRSEYWYFVLFNVIISIALGFIGGMMGISILSNIYSLAILVPSIAVGVRRMHDVGKSGWYLLFPRRFTLLSLLSTSQGLRSVLGLAWLFDCRNTAWRSSGIIP